MKTITKYGGLFVITLGFGTLFLTRGDTLSVILGAVNFFLAGVFFTTMSVVVVFDQIMQAHETNPPGEG